ncbi:short chain dehydrogenase [Thamnocephalis sphaerospora]|uniref:Hydroxysteroid dehydrogenase-like protein 2 n=1 Tax=Thamnocephalis sphaerospora TaxID=78915 RepID=A0A4P9XVX3_9FUNG|nr:short chain dehydrogenase [Thamnocephalis sphaerospora]|eukprot:RKP10192.1 short chain dehydrogenase [Thamnocephalis sphaerospora]
MSLRGKTLFITGASRGIGKAIALRAARDGANIAIAAKTAEPHPKLPGTIYTAAKEVEEAGGHALPIICDIRDEEQVKTAIQKTVDTFGGIDILVNNASAISLTNTENTPVKRYDLMHSINSRGTWMVSKYAIPHLKRGNNPHILNISPPLDMKERWYAPNVAYTMAKIGMSLCVLGMAGELRDYGIAVNALWPLTMIQTAALSQIEGADDSAGSRKPEIMADAAHAVLVKPSRSFSGKFCIDEIVLREQGVTQFDKYAIVPGTKDFQLDFFIDDASFQRLRDLGARHSHI